MINIYEKPQTFPPKSPKFIYLLIIRFLKPPLPPLGQAQHTHSRPACPQGPRLPATSLPGLNLPRAVATLHLLLCSCSLHLEGIRSLWNQQLYLFPRASADVCVPRCTCSSPSYHRKHCGPRTFVFATPGSDSVLASFFLCSRGRPPRPGHRTCSFHPPFLAV